MIGAAAEIAQAAIFQRQILNATLFAAVQSLRLGIEIVAPALKNEHLDRRAGQCQRQRDAGRAAANYRKVGFQSGARRNGAGIDERVQKYAFRGNGMARD